MAETSGSLRLTPWPPSIRASPNADWQILYLTNDGLVGFRKVGGVEGTQLVPDLAVALPKPTDSGKSYTFQVRSGIRYSNGRFVQPEDFKHELERLFEVGGADSGADYSKIVGADRCTAGKPCDLSQRHRRRPHRHTVTFRLTAPDADFLAKLAQPVAFAVPAGTPARDVGVHPLPATGPYRTACLREKGEDCASRPQPLLPRVVDGRAAAGISGFDLVFVASAQRPTDPLRSVLWSGEPATSHSAVPSPRHRPRTTLERLSVRYPSQLHLNTEVHTAYFFLNTRVAPFDDVRVRRAVNIAFDRNCLRAAERPRVRPHLSVPASRHPGVPSHLPVRRGRRDGPRRSATSREELGHGRRPRDGLGLRGGRGSRAVHGVRPGLARVSGEAQGRGHGGNRFQDFFAYSAKVSDSRVGAQTGYIAFLGAWPSATDFLPSIVSCAGFVPAAPDTNSNLSEFCDRSIDAQMAHASAVQAQDPPAATLLWQQVERSLASQAPVRALLQRARRRLRLEARRQLPVQPDLGRIARASSG